MNEWEIALIVAIISALTGIVKSIIDTTKSLKIIERKLDEHNGYAQKFASCDSNIKVIQNDIKWIKQELTK